MINVTTTTSPLTQHEASRLAPASIEVVQRSADKPAIAAYAPVLVPKATEVLALAKHLVELKKAQRVAFAESDEQDALLHNFMLAWVSRLSRDIEGLDPQDFERRAGQTFDLVAKADHLAGILEASVDAPPYVGELTTELKARLAGALAASRAANDVRVALQEKQRQMRAAVAVFHAELVAFRRTLRAVLGSGHRDYQLLRMTRTRTAAEPPVVEGPSVEPSDGANAR